jgi:hypothetical protein
MVSVMLWPCFARRERTSSTHWVEGWVGLRASLDIEGVGKTIFPCLGSNSGHPAKLLQLRYDQSISTRMFAGCVKPKALQVFT